MHSAGGHQGSRKAHEDDNQVCQFNYNNHMQYWLGNEDMI